MRDAFRIMNFPTGETFTYQAEDSETKVGEGNVILHFRKRAFVLGIVYRIGQKHGMCLRI